MTHLHSLIVRSRRKGYGKPQQYQRSYCSRQVLVDLTTVLQQGLAAQLPTSFAQSLQGDDIIEAIGKSLYVDCSIPSQYRGRTGWRCDYSEVVVEIDLYL